MRYFLTFLMIVFSFILLSGCSSKNENSIYEGNYNRINATEFEIKQGVLTSVQVENKQVNLINKWGAYPLNKNIQDDGKIILNANGQDYMQLIKTGEKTIRLQMQDSENTFFDFQLIENK